MPAYICALWYVKLLLQFKARGVRKCIPEYNTEIIQTNHSANIKIDLLTYLLHGAESFLRS